MKAKHAGFSKKGFEGCLGAAMSNPRGPFPLRAWVCRIPNDEAPARSLFTASSSEQFLIGIVDWLARVISLPPLLSLSLSRAHARTEKRVQATGKAPDRYSDSRVSTVEKTHTGQPTANLPRKNYTMPY